MTQTTHKDTGRAHCGLFLDRTHHGGHSERLCCVPLGPTPHAGAPALHARRASLPAAPRRPPQRGGHVVVIVEDRERHALPVNHDPVRRLGGEIVPVHRLIEPFELAVRQAMLQNAVGPVRVEAPPVLAQRLLIRHVDVKDRGLAGDGFTEVRVGGAVAAVLAPARELDQDGVRRAQVRRVAERLVVFQRQPLDQQVPQVVVDEIPVGRGMQPGAAQLLFEQGVFFEPRPQHGKVVQLDEAAHMEPVAPPVVRQVAQEVEQLAFARGGPPVDDEDRENVGHGCRLVLITRGRRGCGFSPECPAAARWSEAPDNSPTCTTA